MQQALRKARHDDGHFSTNGNWVDNARWEQRKTEAAELVGRRYLTLCEAVEVFAVPEDEIVEATARSATLT